MLFCLSACILNFPNLFKIVVLGWHVYIFFPLSSGYILAFFGSESVEP